MPVTSTKPSPVKTSGLTAKLRIVGAFASLSDDQLRTIEPFFYESKYDKETVIFYEQDLPQDNGYRIYFVAEGCVKLVKYSSEGESTIVRLASIGEFFGVTSALSDSPHPFSAEALTNASVLSIHVDDFRRITQQYPAIALDMISAMGKVLWFNYATHNQVVKKSEARVAKIILYHLKRDGAADMEDGLQLKIHLPHDYIASMTGIAYEESVRIISRLKKQHECIQYMRGGRIIITNLSELRLVAQEQEEISF
ncbi:MAG: Crp/Fnr family transcriptional regulator [Cyanobacteria bacterium HKST-UBA06]|nr:Crp/Fnr family transcriptional regulator [Cyanobacteria bacterium HKST-UBA04]MCA9806620.1 Crp/Fnr family transcriptional regulator [Cyanobacteria bacterium HKST-UBA06]MCA9842191.1 Crp/Fnr family transcriptional regulator [Cyanobacteria bacterium HKST-UBA03]